MGLAGCRCGNSGAREFTPFPGESIVIQIPGTASENASGEAPFRDYYTSSPAVDMAAVDDAKTARDQILLHAGELSDAEVNIILLLMESGAGRAELPQEANASKAMQFSSPFPRD